MRPWELGSIAGALLASGGSMMIGLNAGPSICLAGILCAAFGLRRCFHG